MEFGINNLKRIYICKKIHLKSKSD